MGSADFRLIRPVGVTADSGFSVAPKWVYNKDGMLVQVPADTLAVTYDLADLSKAPYALIEPAATNLIQSSETFTTGWANSLAVSPSSDSFGGIPYKYLSKTYSSAYEYRSHTTGAVSAGGTLVATLALRAGTVDTVSFGLYDPPTLSWGTSAETSIEVIGPGVVVQSYGQFTLTGLSATADTFVTIKRTYGSGTTSSAFLIYPGGWASTVAGASIQATRVQVEKDRATSYIPTAGSAVTRAADVIAPGAGLVYSNVLIAERSYSAVATFAKDELVYDLASRLTYLSLIDNNTGRSLTDKTAWVKQLATNRWRMFDKAVNSQTSAPELLVVAINPGALVNTLGLLNVDGARVTVYQTESGYSRTKSLVRHDVLNWYDWFYEEPIREGDVVFDDIPPYANSTLIIVVENPGGNAAIGCCVLGKARTIGQTNWDFTGGALSYSSAITDGFGNITMARRDNAKILNFEVSIPRGFESEAYRLLRDCTDVEIMIVGAEDYSMTYSYGFLGQWSVPVTNKGKTAHIEFRGLAG